MVFLQLVVLFGLGAVLVPHHSIGSSIGSSSNNEYRLALPRQQRASSSLVSNNSTNSRRNNMATTADDEFEYDAVIVPGGGVELNGAPREWVVARLDEAAKRYATSARYFVVLSRGTTHKPPPPDKEGFPVDEADASARYLISKHNIAEKRILMDTWSLDTIGNAYFTAAMITEPLGLSRLAVVTSTFHNSRTEAIFRWVWGVVQPEASLIFTPSADVGFTDEQLAERKTKEASSLGHIAHKKAKYDTKAKLASFILLEHGAYTAKSKPRPPVVKTGVSASY